MLDEVKKKMASVNFTLLLFVAAFAIHRGVDPCERLLSSLTGVGVSDIGIESPAPPDGAGPRAPSALVVQLQDGQSVRILENGAVVVEGVSR